MDSVAKIAQPGLQAAAVCLLDQIAIRNNTRLARDRSPLARAINEGHVHVWIIGQVVGLAGLGVCVEEKINATGFLLEISCCEIQIQHLQQLSYRSSQAHAARNQIVVRRSLNGCQHAKFTLCDEVNKIRNQRVEISFVLVRMSVWVGRLIAQRCAGSSCGHCDRYDMKLYHKREKDCSCSKEAFVLNETILFI